MTQPLQVPLLAPLGTRYQSLTVDSRLINGFMERDPQTGQAFVYKRPGFKSRSTALPAGTVLGLFNWRGSVYAITSTNLLVDAQLYKNGVLVGNVNSLGGFYTADSGLGATPRLFFHNASAGYAIDEAGTLTLITDVDFPPNRAPAKTMIPGAVYLNGVFYVMTTEAVFANSDALTNNDPLAWEAAVLTAEFEGVAVVAIAKNLVYVVVMKDFFTEVFYDAANAVGNPLGTVAGGKLNFGLKSARSLANCGGDLVFVAQTEEGSLSVVRISQLSASVISTPPVERILEAANFSTVYSWSCRIEGHRFYGLTLPASNITLVYDITAQFWYQWTDTNGNYLPYAFATIDTNGKTLFIHESTGETFNLDALTFADDGQLFSCEIYTPNLSQDARTKIAGVLHLIGDRVDGSTAELRWSDDDYATWSSPQTLDLALERPQVSDMGSFYRRAFHLKHRADKPFRVERAVIYTGAGA